MDPASLKASWDGTSTTATAAFANGGCGANDSVTVTGVNLGSLCLGGGTYVCAAQTFTNSTMVLSGSGTALTITLGTPSGAFGTQAGNTTMSWTPSASALDVAGNACSTAVVTESGAADKEF
jgi:hypothetical protein